MIAVDTMVLRTKDVAPLAEGVHERSVLFVVDYNAVIGEPRQRGACAAGRLGITVARLG